jgi:TolB-like protein
MRKLPLTCLMVWLLFSLSLTGLFSESQKTIAVMDFSVLSSNPDYTYWGKGFAEFLSVELSDIPGIVLVDRSKRNDIMKEQAFSLSGMADETSAVELGQLLSAQYLVSGEIFDMMGDLVVTVKLVNVETGLVDSSAKADGPPKNYKQIISALSASLAEEIVPKEAARVELAKAEKPVELKEEEARVVLTAFSQAVDAVDKNNVQEAKEKLQVAQKIDKNNRAVKFYLSKLQSVSPKFNVELIYYAPSINPALLGFMERDRLYLTINGNVLNPYQETYPSEPGDDSHSDFNWQIQPGTYYMLNLMKSELGYAIPLTTNLGLCFEISGGVISNIIRDMNYEIPAQPVGEDIYLASSLSSFGGRLSLGYKPSESWGLGLSGYLFNSTANLGKSDGEGDPRSNTLSGSATLGVFMKPGQGKLNLDSSLTVPFLQEIYLDYDIKTYVAYKSAPYPVVWETTVIYPFLDNKLFIAAKEVMETYISFGEDDRFGVATRTIASAEYWFNQKFSARLGGEYDFMYLMEKMEHGGGALGGLSFKWGDFTLDANYTWMSRALRFYPGYTVPDTTMLIQFSYEGLFQKGVK